jgi:hypothetical protein
MKSLSHISPVGKLVRFDNINVVADITPKLETFDIEALYRFNGKKLEWGERATEAGELYNEKFVDLLYNELDSRRFFEIKRQKTEPKQEEIAGMN